MHDPAANRNPSPLSDAHVQTYWSCLFHCVTAQQEGTYDNYDWYILTIDRRCAAMHKADLGSHLLEYSVVIALQQERTGLFGIWRRGGITCSAFAGKGCKPQ